MERGKWRREEKKDSRTRVIKIDDKWMMLRSHSDTHPPPPAVSFVSSQRKIKTGRPTGFFCPFFSLILFSFLHTGPSRSGYLASFLSLPPTLLVIAWVRMGDTTGSSMNPPPTICHSSHPTIDSCLYPLTLSPLHFSW